MFTRYFLGCFVILQSLLLFSTPLTHAFSVSEVGKVVEAEEYNDALKMWIDRRLALHVSSSKDIFFLADTSLGQATTRLYNSKGLKEALEATVAKALKWSKIAKKNKVKTYKVIRCFGQYAKSCTKNGHVSSPNHLLFAFGSGKGGKQTDLIITIIDEAHDYKKSTLYLGVPEMKQLLANIRKIDKGIQEAKATEKKQNLFQ